MSPLPRDSAVNKSLIERPKPPPSGVPVFRPWKPAQPAKLQPFEPAQFCGDRDAEAEELLILHGLL
jgi:hypothetical protein